MKHVWLALTTLALGTLGAGLVASCASNIDAQSTDGGSVDADGHVKAQATITGTVIGPTATIVRPPPTIILDPCLTKSCPSDGLNCTLDCSRGVCGFTPITCDDGNACTNDRCNETDGSCVHTNNTNPCSDGNVCTLEDRCSGGACVPGTALNCDDGNPCTADTCDPVDGCKHDPVMDGTDCDDHSTCTATSACQGGLCVGTGANGCVDSNPCTDEICGTTCTHQPATGRACGTDKCISGQKCDANGQCTGGTAVKCDDGNPCTKDSCDSATGCKYTADDTATCTDNDACTTGDHCAGGSCVADVGIQCAAIDSCHDAGTCDKQTGICSDPRKADNTPCETTGVCTGGRCVGGTPTGGAGGAGGASGGGPTIGEAGAGGEGGDTTGTPEGGAPTTGHGGSPGNAGKPPVDNTGDTGGSTTTTNTGAPYKRNPGGCSITQQSDTPFGLIALLGTALGAGAFAARRRKARQA